MRDHRIAKRNSVRTRPATRISAREQMVQEQWDYLVDSLPGEMLRRKLRHENDLAAARATPRGTEDSYLKCEVYLFTCDVIDANGLNELESVITRIRYPYIPRGVSIHDNPFHWVFSGLRQPDQDISARISRMDASRYGRQLAYAYRHRVPVELLIGFIYQSGVPDFVAEKAKDTSYREGWWTAEYSESAEQAWRAAQATRRKLRRSSM